MFTLGHAHILGSLNKKQYWIQLTTAIAIPVAWAAMFVPFLAFLKPSMPQDLIIFTAPGTQMDEFWDKIHFQKVCNWMGIAFIYLN